MSQTHQLIDLNVNLFLYDLRDPIGSSPERVNENRREFWSRIYGDNLPNDKLATFRQAEDTFSNYVELLGKTSPFQKFEGFLDGYYYPVQLGDTYALMVECAGKPTDPDWQQLSQWEQLRQTKEIILEQIHHKPGKLGQTWLISGQLSSPNSDPEAVAKDCYEKIEIISNPNWKRDFKGHRGRLLNATLFEIEKVDSTPDNINNNHQIIICLFDSDKPEDEMQKTILSLCREDFMRLFHYRNKILWVYEQSRQVKNKLKESVSVIHTIIDSLPGQVQEKRLPLSQLQTSLADALSISYPYETVLNVLQEQRSTIEVNLGFYRERVQLMKDRDPDADLKFLDPFGESAADKLGKISTDYESLKSGLKPLENFIKTVEGIIEIEKTKNERTLNQTIAIASVGISTATLTATTFTFEQSKGIVEQLWLQPASPTPPNPPAGHLVASFLLTFLLSIIIGLASAGIIWCILNPKEK